MKEYAGHRTQTSYCWYGAWYRKNTSFWTSFKAHLRHPCTQGDPCPCVQAYEVHPFTAQSGRSKNGQLGMGSGRAVEGYPVLLLYALLDEHFPVQGDLFARSLGQQDAPCSA